MPGKLRHSCAQEPSFAYMPGKLHSSYAKEPIFANDMRLFWAWPGEDIRRGQDGESPVCLGSEGYLMSRRVMSKIRVENALIAPAGREP